MKVAINTCFGGFGITDAAFEKLLERKGIAFVEVKSESGFLGSQYYEEGHAGSNEHYISMHDLTADRADLDLIAVIEEMGSASWGAYSEIKIVNIPNGIDWYIDEYDGREHVAERHKTWN
jgi:hypothetical protein